MPTMVGVMADSYNKPAAGGGPVPAVAGCSGWWDASDPASLTASGGLVSQWNDKSLNGFHVVQGTGSAQPQTGAFTINGLNVLRFDAADRMTRPTTLLANATTGEWTMFAVGMAVNVTGSRCLIASQDATAANQLAQYIRNSGTTAQAIAWSTTTAFTDSGGTITISVPVMYSAIRGPTSVEIWVNGVSAAATATTGTPSAETATLEIGAVGGASFWAGDIAEVVAYSRALNTTERQQVETYLRSKWGTP